MKKCLASSFFYFINTCRQIHAVDTPPLSSGSGRKSPQKIEIPAMPVNLSDAFTNIRLHRESGDLQPVAVTELTEHPTSFYSAMAGTTIMIEKYCSL